MEQALASTVGRGVGWALRDPVVWVFLLAGTFEVLSSDPTLHATLLFAVGAVLVIDAARRRLTGVKEQPALRPAAPPRARATAAQLVAGGLAFALFVGMFPRYTPPVTVAIWAPGAIAVVWAWRVPSRQSSVPRLTAGGVAAWVCLFVAFGIWELVALVSQPSLSVSSPGHPTLSTLLDPILAHPLGRIIAISVWVAGGWFLVER